MPRVARFFFFYSCAFTDKIIQQPWPPEFSTPIN
jgi:hypothetical protein